MNKISTLLLAGILLATAAHGQPEENGKAAAAEETVEKVAADIDGAVPGRWTMDLEAARKVAAEKKLPILLDFSGSDWCGWCKLMENNVFTRPEWQAYATDNIMMVLIDFPNDKSLVPEKYVERNNALKDEYGIGGYPTFVVLDDDGKTELGRLKAGREKTPESFIAELKQLFKSRASAVTAFVESLAPEARAAFQKLQHSMDEAKTALEDQMMVIEEANAKAAELEETISKLEDEIKEFRIAQLGEETLKEYQELKAKADAAVKKLEEWIATDPDRSEENMKLYQEMVTGIQDLQKQLSEF